MPTRVIAACLGLIGFIVAILAGLAVNNPVTTTLWRAIVAMLLCYAVGSVIGTVAERAISEHIEQYKVSHPLPGERGGGAAAESNSQTSAGSDGASASPREGRRVAAGAAPREGAAA